MAYTSIDDPSAHFQIATWAGSGATQSITFNGNSNMQPDWVWTKPRGIAFNHALMDSSRGVGSSGKTISSNLTNAEADINDYVMTLDSDGFSVGAGDAGFNASNDTYVSWCWKANGGTTSSNTDGSITSTVQANTTAGFSIVTYTGTGSAGTVGHGLGATPAMIIVKNRDTAVDWSVYHKNLTDAGYVIALNSSDAEVDSGTNRWNHTDPTSSVFSVGSGQQTNQSSNDMVAYCFGEKQGFSKFGKYVGNGSATNGTFVHTGFKPAFVMYKSTASGDGWFMFDAARNPTNVSTNQTLRADTSGAESASKVIDFFSNGFKLMNSDSAHNGSGVSYIYLSFASNPFVTSNTGGSIPTTAF